MGTLAPVARRKGSGVFRVPYTRVDLSPHTELAPMVPARLWWRGGPMVEDLIMDTGATLTLFPPWLAEALGMELGPPAHPGRGIGGSVPLRPSKVHLQIALKDTHGRPGRTWLLDPVMVASSDYVVPVPLLGRRPFLLHHQLLVREDLGEFTLRELPD